MSSFRSDVPGLRKFILLVVVCLVIIPSAAAQSGYLRVTATDGEGAFNDIRHRMSHAPAVRVVDEENNPAPGAEVVFTLPALGPGGVFAGGSQTATAIADKLGVATCPAFVPNGVEGRFNIRVQASFLGKTGTATVSQSNTLAGGISVGEKKGHGKLWVVALVVAGGAAAGGILAERSRGSSAPAAPPPTSLSVVSVTVGGPR